MFKKGRNEEGRGERKKEGRERRKEDWGKKGRKVRRGMEETTGRERTEREGGR